MSILIAYLKRELKGIANSYTAVRWDTFLFKAVFVFCFFLKKIILLLLEESYTYQKRAIEMVK